jgi:hypothetical protein
LAVAIVRRSVDVHTDTGTGTAAPPSVAVWFGFEFGVWFGLVCLFSGTREEEATLPHDQQKTLLL